MKYQLKEGDEILWVRKDGTIAEYKLFSDGLLQIGTSRVKLTDTNTSEKESPTLC